MHSVDASTVAGIIVLGCGSVKIDRYRAVEAYGLACDITREGVNADTGPRCFSECRAEIRVGCIVWSEADGIVALDHEYHACLLPGPNGVPELVQMPSTTLGRRIRKTGYPVLHESDGLDLNPMRPVVAVAQAEIEPTCSAGDLAPDVDKRVETG